MRIHRLAFLVLSTMGLALAAAGDDQLSYVFKQGDRSRLHANGPVEAAVRVSKKFDGDFIWVRDSGREYLIRDAAVLQQAADAFRELDALEPSLQAAEKKVTPYEDKMEEIEQKMDDLSDQLDDDELADSARHSIETKLHDVEEQMHSVESRMHDAESQMEALEKQMDDREEAAEQKLETIIEKAIRNGIAKRAE
jgi:septal ring factor EnvC (AmiA/AmiB activator)